MLYHASGSLVCSMVLLLQAECIMSVLATPSMSSLAATPAATTTSPTRTELVPRRILSDARLARITAYWAGEGDHYTGLLLSATGVHLHVGHCAVDPKIIPYGSVVEVAGIGTFLAVDTGSAVVSRRAARKDAHTSEERKALVIDLFFNSRKAGEAFAASSPKYVSITWSTSTLTLKILSAPVITPISMPLRLGIPLNPLRLPDEIAAASMRLRLGFPLHPLRSLVEVATQ